MLPRMPDLSISTARQSIHGTERTPRCQPTTGNTPFSFDVAVKQDWAPDGKHLVFSIYGDVPIPGVSTNIVTVRPKGSDLRFVTHYEGGDLSANVGSYSPDGRWIVFRLTDHGTFGLYKIRPDGTHLTAILPLSSFRPRFIAWGSRPDDVDSEDDDAQLGELLTRAVSEPFSARGPMPEP